MTQTNNSNSPTILRVPFLYEAVIVKPRCRKPVLVAVKDSIEIQIDSKSLSDLPAAFLVGDKEIRWDGEKLWDFYMSTSAKTDPEKVQLSEVIKNTLDNGESYIYSCAGAKAPFKNFWSNLQWSNDKLGSKHGISETHFNSFITDESVLEKSEIQHREWVEDNREKVVELLKSIAGGMISVDGTMYQTASEPRYEIVSFGAGNNYSVAMFISYGYNPNLAKTCYFNALELEKANESLLNRSPKKDFEPRTNCGNTIKVLIPEAVKCVPDKDHVE